jgi:hypothetical protein
VVAREEKSGNLRAGPAKQYDVFQQIGYERTNQENEPNFE